MPTINQVMDRLSTHLSGRIHNGYAEMSKQLMYIYIETKDFTLTPNDVITASGVDRDRVFVNIETPRLA